MTGLRDIWVYLSASPLLHLTLTLAAYQVGHWLYRKFDFSPLCNPVLVAVACLVLILWSSGISYDRYFAGAQFVHFLLGPATVALALPLYRELARVRRSLLALGVAIIAGSMTAIVSAIVVAWGLGATRNTLVSLAPKSVTAPVAMGITEKLGGLPSLTAVLVILTGILGAMLGPMVLNRIGVRDWPARGVALGTASHGIGTARALQVNQSAGAFAGLAMGLNALATALMLPLLWRLFVT
jgi:predicted murein hydrolase (TIGR00659 family)